MSSVRYDRGFCYLSWFREMSVDDTSLHSVARSLGAYPPVCNVIAALYTYADSPFQLLSDVTFDGHLLHVSAGGPRVPFYHLMLEFVGKCTPIGAEHSPDYELLRTVGIDADAVLRAFVESDLKNANSPIRERLQIALTERVSASINSTKRGNSVVIPFHLTATEQFRLQSNFPELSLTFSGNRSHSHAFSAAHRRCETEICLREVGYDIRARPAPGFVAVVKDIGGNYYSHLACGRYNVHSCCPVLDGRDALRGSSRLFDLQILRQNSTGMRRQVLDKILNDDAELRRIVCMRTGQSCTLTAPTGLLIHSTYDFCPRDLADALDVAKIFKCAGTFLFSTGVLLSDSGEIPYQSCFWRKSRGSDGRMKIRFSFRADSSLDYEHDFETYVQLVTGHTITSSSGSIFFVEIKGVRDGVVFFTLIRNVLSHVPRSVLSHNLWTGDDALVAIQYYEYVPKVSEPHFLLRPTIVLRKKKFMVQRRIVDAGISYALSVSQQKYSVQTIFEYLRSLNNRVIVNGVDVICPDRVDAERLYDTAYAIYVFGFRKRYESSLVLNAVLEDEKLFRESENSGFWSNFWRKISRCTDKIVLDNDSVGNQRSWFHRIWTWLAYERRFPVSIEKAVTFIPFEEVVDEFIAHGSSYVQSYTATLNDQGVFVLDHEVDPQVEKFVGDALDSVGGSTASAPSGRSGGTVEKSSVGSVAPVAGSVLKAFKDHFPVEKSISDDVSNAPEGVLVNNVVVNKEKIFEDNCPVNIVNTVNNNSIEKASSVSSGAAAVVTRGAPGSDGCFGVSVECKENLRLVRVKGDGQCCFSALLLVSGMSESPFELRQILLRSKFLEHLYAPDETRRVLEDVNAWGDDEVVRLFALHFRKIVCIHVDNSYCVRMCGFHAGEVVHVAFRPGHYDALLPDVPMVPVSTATTVEREFGCVQGAVVVDVRSQSLVDPGVIIPVENEIGSLRDSLSGVDPLVLSSARERANPAEGLSSGKFVCRSALKLMEIDLRLSILEALPSGAAVVDLCGAPGGMLQYLMIHPKKFSDIFCISLKQYLLYNYSRLPKVDVNVHFFFSSHLSGDLLVNVVVDEFCTYVRSVCVNGVRLVVADGAVDCRGRESEQAALNSPLFMSEIECARRVLADGGCFILKVFDFFLPEFVILLSDFSVHFRDVSFVKPLSSRPACSEKYLVFSGFSSDGVYPSISFERFRSASFQFEIRQVSALKALRVCIDDEKITCCDPDLVKRMRGFLKGQRRLDKFQRCGDISSLDIPCFILCNGCVVENAVVGLTIPSFRSVKVSDHVFRGRVPSSLFDKVERFVDTLPLPNNAPAFGRMGQRQEWLFSSCDYTYGKGRVVRPCAPFSVVSSFCADIVKIFGLQVPNACLLVFYPPGTTGLNLHRDDEPVHDSEQVITICVGASCDLVLADNSRKIFNRQNLRGGDFYVFKEQRDFLHGVEGITQDGVGRWAFTFRVFKGSADDVLDREDDGSCVSECVSTCDVSVCETDITVVSDDRVTVCCDMALSVCDSGVCVDVSVSDNCDVVESSVCDGGVGMSVVGESDVNVVVSECLNDLCDSVCEIVREDYVNGIFFDLLDEFVVDVCRDEYKDEEVVNECDECVELEQLASAQIVSDKKKKKRAGKEKKGKRKKFLGFLSKLGFSVTDASVGVAVTEVVSSVPRLEPTVVERVTSVGPFFRCEKCVSNECGCVRTVTVGLKCDKSEEKNVCDDLDKMLLERSVDGMRPVAEDVRPVSTGRSVSRGERFDRLKQTRSMQSVNPIGCNSADREVLSRVYVSAFCPVETPIFVCLNDVLCYPVKVLFNVVSFIDGELVCLSDVLGDVCEDVDDYVDDVRKRCDEGSLSQGLFLAHAGRTRFDVIITLVSSPKSFLIDLAKFLTNFPRVCSSTLILVCRSWLLERWFLRASDVVGVFSQFDANAYPHRYQLYVSDRHLYKSFNNELKFLCRFPGKLDDPRHDATMYDHWRKPPVDRLRDLPYAPVYFETNGTPDVIARNAMVEQLELWRAREKILFGEHKSFYSLLPREITSDVRERVQMSSEGYGLYDLDLKKFIIPPRVMRSQYEYGFDGARFVRFDDACKRGVELCSRRLLVSNGTELMQDERLYTACKNLDIKKFSLPSVTLKQGVPGCGKTTYILKNYRKPSAQSVGDLILFSTREGVEDFRTRACELDSSVTDFEKKNFRTLHSFLINSRGENFDRVIVDEALMMHAGELLFSAYKAKCRELILVGDQYQIPFINRTPQCQVLYSDPMRFASVSEVLSVSYRCTLTVAALLFDRYPDGMKATSRVLGEMRTRVFSSLASVPKDKDTKYLVFKQSEKAELLRAGYNVSTIHEFQGKQARNVVVVRMSRKKEDIYNRAAHCLVAITRHTKSFTYYSPVSDDQISKYIILASCLSREKIDRAKFDLSGGYIRDDFVLTPPLLAPSRSGIVTHDNIYSCVGRWGVPDVRVLVPLYSVKNVGPVVCPFVAPDKCVDVGVLQNFYDLLLPGNSLVDMRFDSLNVVNECDLNVFLESTTIDLSKRTRVRMVKFDKLRPVLRTAMAPPRPSNQVETLLAMIKRNQNVPDIVGDIAKECLASLMIKNFVNTYIHPDFLDLLNIFGSCKILPNSASISEWLTTQKPAVLNRIGSDCFIGEKSLVSYNFMVKSTVKPQMDLGAVTTYASLQTIAYHDKDINAIFCPIFREIKKRLLAVLDPRFLLFCDISPDDFSDELSARFDADFIQSCKKLEIDISKYDKSQGEVALMFEVLFMRLFGVDEEYICLWERAHVTTRLRDRMNGVKCKVAFQRKSGDASTYLGNTVFLMAVVASLFDLSTVVMGLFSGDDSLLVGGNIDFDRNEECALLFNLESKFFRNYDYMYFCSKFLCVFGGKFFFIPDPLKFITKLGRSDLVNWFHVEEYRVSLVDLTKSYSNLLVYECLSCAVNERYGGVGFHGQVFSCLFFLVRDKILFHDLFFSLPGDVLCMDVCRPGLD